MPVIAMRDKKAFDATMIAVIIYDKYDFATKANAMLERAAQRTGETEHWRVKPWRADILKLPPAAEEALAEAAEAHLILLAMRQVQSFLPWLLGWLERWAVCRRFMRPAWPCGVVETPTQARCKRCQSCRTLPGVMA